MKGSPQRDRLTTAPCGFLSFTDEGTLTYVNDTLLEMLGYQRDEIVGRHIERIFTVGSRIFYQTHWFPLLRLHGRAEEIFLMLRASSGEDVGALVNAVRTERGGTVEYDIVVMRVRERRKYEDELLRARRAAERARADVEARQDDLQRAHEQLEAQASELELQQQQLQEQAATLEAASEELRRANEDLLTRSEEAEYLRRVAEDANQAKSAFLAVMSHEMRTPLNAISGYLEILEMGLQGPINDAQRKSLTRIDRSQRHLLRLINDVLDLARIEAGQMEYEIEDVLVSEIVEAALPMVEPQLASKHMRFEVAIAPDLAVRADRERIQQVLLNLLGNAVKFTPDGGRVRVDAAPSAAEPDRLLLQVRDTGIGIPAAKLEAIFEPFVQVDASHTRGEAGTGLGLAISRDLVRGMNGDLTAESVPGEGSTFTLSLPSARPY